jgi:dihydrofolate reductase
MSSEGGCDAAGPQKKSTHIQDMQRKVILYIAMSLDGYIAKEDGDLAFLNSVSVPGEDYGYAAFQGEVDTLIWGRKTYDMVLSFGIDFPHADKACYVWSGSRTGYDGQVTYVADLAGLVRELKEKPGKHIYCDGGAEVVAELLRHGLIDELRVSVIPHLLGGGVRLFKDGLPEQALRLRRSVSYPSGLVQLWYARPAEEANVEAATPQTP